MNEDDYQIYYADAKLTADGILDALMYEHSGEWQFIRVTNPKYRLWHQRFTKQDVRGIIYYELRQYGKKPYIWEIEIADFGHRYRLLERINIDLLNTPQENIDLVLLSRL